MLQPQEIVVGPVNAAEPNSLTLILPRTKYESPMLIAGTPDGLFAIFLGGEQPFHAFDCSGNDTWKGAMIGGVTLELDETSLFDP